MIYANKAVLLYNIDQFVERREEYFTARTTNVLLNKMVNLGIIDLFLILR